MQMIDPSELLDGLNDQQREAVASPLGFLRVIAGAGSGKTRVLVHRIAWLIAIEKTSPYQILAVTFTNKAANVMKERLGELLGQSLTQFWVGTFHSICHKMLRMHHDRVGLNKDFQIIDRDDQTRIIKRFMKAHDFDEGFLKPTQVVNTISHYKEQGKRYKDLDKNTYNPIEKHIHFFYELYEAHCKAHSLVDFSELMFRTVELLRDDDSIRAHYQSRFKHILVDEFQDTNSIQFALIQLLSHSDTDLLVVGDDDQSIYGFRGAKVEHILELENHFPKLNTIKLEQNYRSTATILNAANAVIAQNPNRLGKSLWTDQQQGDAIDVYQSINEYDEAYYVSDRIKTLIESGNHYSDIAILYRSNAQSRLFEENFIADAIPYRIYGGLRFFDRAEIKDALAYLKLVINHQDNTAFERIVNVPARGIGLKTLDQIRATAASQSLSLFDASIKMVENNVLPNRAHTALSKFVNLITTINISDTKTAKEIPLGDFTKVVIEASGLIDYLENKKPERYEDKIENIKELANAAEQFYNGLQEEDQSEAKLLFLAQTALDAGETQASEYSDYVQMMSLHSAKGMEFPFVFIVGIEEGLFPHKESSIHEDKLSEERRLAYVGITRAEKKLYLSYAEKRRLYGETIYPKPSRFIEEIPNDILNYIRGMPNFSHKKPSSLTLSQKGESSVSAENQVRIGQLVFHEKFGEGMVIDIEGEGERQRAQVNFSHAGSKWLILAFAKLTRLE